MSLRVQSVKILLFFHVPDNKLLSLPDTKANGKNLWNTLMLHLDSGNKQGRGLLWQPRGVKRSRFLYVSHEALRDNPRILRKVSGHHTPWINFECFNIYQWKFCTSCHTLKIASAHDSSISSTSCPPKLRSRFRPQCNSSFVRHATLFALPFCKRNASRTHFLEQRNIGARNRKYNLP